MTRTHQTGHAGTSVRHYVAGGTEHGGGIGRLVGYICTSGSQASHRVTDTRGPRWNRLVSPLKLAQAMSAMAVDRITAPTRVHHIHIAGRGSTARKLILGALARRLGCIHIVHLHDYDYADDFTRRPDWQKRAIRKLFNGADRVIVLGGRDRDTAINQLDTQRPKVSVLHNAVPDPGVARTRTRPASDPVRLVFLGQLGPRKGVPELLRALAHPTMTGLPWQAVLAGDGPVDAYREEADALGLSARVTLPGWLTAPQVQTLCRGSDVLVLPSHGEGMAMAVLEGMAHGLAVVTTPVGAHTEVLTDGVTGVFVPVGDVTALAETLARLVMHDTERNDLSNGARAQYLSAFSIAAYAVKLDALYRSTAKEARASRAVRAGAA